jgi:TorA maturation chaperone TorD
MVECSSSQVSANRAALYHWLALAFFAPPTPAEIVDMCDGKNASSACRRWRQCQTRAWALLQCARY